jgi:hypothetical protein
MKFIKDGLSINEARISALVLGFFVAIGIGGYQVVTDGDISNNVLTLLGYLIMAIAGVNVAHQIKSKKSSSIGE